MVVGYIVSQKNKILEVQQATEKIFDIGSFDEKRTCATSPVFLSKLKIQRPIIDLSQERFKGLAFIYGRNLSKVLHPKAWERFEHFSTYALDDIGNMYLAPMPFISVKPTTFNLQKNIYKLDTMTGKLSIWMHLDDVNPSPNNPYGIISLVYDCDDKTLWVSAIDETDYGTQKGVIYHINPKSKKILQRIEGKDALTLQILKTDKGKYLLAGSARESLLYAYNIDNAILSSNPKKLFDLPISGEFIRKIKIIGKNHIELQVIPFSYTLIAQSVKKDRSYYDAIWDKEINKWSLVKRN